MANIQNYLNQIKTAVFGKDVRESIHDAIKQCYDDATVNHDNANMEVKLARGSHNTLNDRLDENEKKQENLSSQLDNIENDLLNSFDIIPDRLRDSDSETDADLLQKAINLSLNNILESKIIKLNRKYVIDKQIYLNKSASYSDNSIHINIEGGQLELGYDGFMFDGIKNSGGLTFTNTLFLHGSFTHTLFNCRNLIQLDFNHCQFKDTYTICEAEYITENNIDDYVQSIHFNMCNFKGMKDYQVKGMRFFDVTLCQSYVEWGKGGFCKTYQKTSNNFSTLNCIIRDNVIEGISEQVPLSFKHSFALVIEGNYFEGNSKVDIEFDTSATPNRSITISKNFFGDYNTNIKQYCVDLGNVAWTMVDLTGNKGTKSIFYTSSISNSPKFNITGCDVISGQNVFRNQSDIKKSIFDMNYLNGKTLTTDGKIASLPIKDYSRDLIYRRYSIDISYDLSGSPLYRQRLVGDICFIVGYDTSISSVALEVKLIPSLCIDGNGFVNNSNLNNWNVVFSSTGTNRIAITSHDKLIEDKIDISPKHGATTVYKAKLIDTQKILEYN